MPYLNKPPKREKKSTYHSNTDMRKLRQQAYNTTQWRQTRETYLKQHPLCEECLNKGKVTPASSVHHIDSPFKTGEINYHLLLDFDNLMAICHECHGEHHAKEQGHTTTAEIITRLDELLNDNQ